MCMYLCISTSIECQLLQQYCNQVLATKRVNCSCVTSIKIVHRNLQKRIAHTFIHREEFISIEVEFLQESKGWKKF